MLQSVSFARFPAHLPSGFGSEWRIASTTAATPILDRLLQHADAVTPPPHGRPSPRRANAGYTEPAGRNRVPADGEGRPLREGGVLTDRNRNAALCGRGNAIRRGDASACRRGVVSPPVAAAVVLLRHSQETGFHGGKRQTAQRLTAVSGGRKPHPRRAGARSRMPPCRGA
jgi:hypothetical protein